MMKKIGRRDFLQMCSTAPGVSISLNHDRTTRNCSRQANNFGAGYGGSMHPGSRNYGDWDQERLLRFMLGQHTPDVDQDEDMVKLLGDGDADAARKRIWEKIEPAGIVDIVKKTGADVFYFYAKCHFGNAYYPSKIGHAHSMMRGRDYFREMIDACHKADLIPAALYECLDYRIRQEKPEWCNRNEDGSVGKPCFNSPYCDFCACAGP